MSQQTSYPKPLIGLLLAGLTYLGIRRFASQSSTSAVLPARSADIADTEPLAPAKHVSRPPTVPSAKIKTAFPLQYGSRGTLVADIQKALGIKDDGIFGKDTLAALKAKHNIVSVSQDYYNRIVQVKKPAVEIQGSHSPKGWLAMATAPYVLPGIKITVPAGFLLGYTTGRFNTSADLVTITKIEVTCSIDGKAATCPETLKKYDKQRFTYWVSGGNYKTYSGIEAAAKSYPNVRQTAVFIRP